MTEQEKKDAKQRIFDAALSLFAHKGYDAVGTREIAKKANVNIAMINYYFGGKLGILKQIINQAFEKHECAITATDIKLPAEEFIRSVIENFIDFFKENTELALVAFDTLPYGIHEINDIKNYWAKGHMRLLQQLFDKFGLDPEDKVQMSLFNGLLGNIVLAHFRGRYSYEQVTHESPKDYNDEFYRNFAKTLTKFYLDGVRGIAAQQKKEKEIK